MRPHTDVSGDPAPDPGIDLAGASADQAREWLDVMLLIREFETAAGPLAASGAIPSGLHTAIGQEAVAVGVVSVLGRDDVAAAPHRSHHIALAKGMDPRAMMAELFGKATGCAGGRGGHMHLADFGAGFFGSNGIVGGGAGLALGAALAQSYRGDRRVSAGFFGDGGANTGRVWEFVNLAAAWRLPLLLICENNGYAVETRVGDAMAGESVARRAAGFGLPAMSAASTAPPRRSRGGSVTGTRSSGCVWPSPLAATWTTPGTSGRCREPGRGSPTRSPAPSRLRSRTPAPSPTA